MTRKEIIKIVVSVLIAALTALGAALLSFYKIMLSAIAVTIPFHPQVIRLSE